jgi:predicted GNAT family N-acyltransferase
MDVRVELVPARVTVPLRQRVLRPHQTTLDAVLPGENDPGSAHIAAITGSGEVVATAVLIREPFRLMPERRDAWRLRGMATEEGRRGQGVGGRVLRYGIDYVASNGGGLLWCHARIPAQGFYQRAGFSTIGEPWTYPETGPHVAMWVEVPAAEAAATG